MNKFFKRMTFDQYRKCAQRLCSDDPVIDLMKPMIGFLKTKGRIVRVIVDDGVGDCYVDGQFMREIRQN